LGGDGKKKWEERGEEKRGGYSREAFIGAVDKGSLLLTTLDLCTVARGVVDWDRERES
jgi:hypothetical protein